jgi:isopenicillin N synthase-like dioxygenase
VTGESTHHHDVTVVNGYVPVIDLGLPGPADSPRRAAVAEAVLRACETSGFFVIVGHAVPEATVAGLYRAARQFFSLDESAKRAIPVDPADTLQRGWERYLLLEKFTATALGEGAGPGRAPEADTFGLQAPNKWPAIPGFREAFMNYYGAMEHLAMELMRLIARALDVPEHWFDDKFEGHMSPCALNYYIPQPAPPAPGSLRNRPHTDFGTVTILYQDEAPGGLQVRDREGTWLDVPPAPGSFVVNLGHLMSMWTNDRLASTVHQVVNPPARQAHLDRISIAFFHQPAPGALIECVPSCTDEHNPPRHKPVTSGNYFVSRSRRLFVQRRLDQAPDLPTGNRR